MTQLIPIGAANAADPFYRYKMPVLNVRYEGSGAHIRTHVCNLTDIAKALERSDADIMKFFSYELGSMTQGHVIHGKIAVDQLKTLLDKFIDMYVICSGCGNPETTCLLHKKQLATSCRACGDVRKIKNQSHKLSEYMIKRASHKSKQAPPI